MSHYAKLTRMHARLERLARALRCEALTMPDLSREAIEMEMAALAYDGQRRLIQVILERYQ